MGNNGKCYCRKVGYSGIKQCCLSAQVTKYSTELGRGPPQPPLLTYPVNLGKRKEGYLGIDHLLRSPLHHSNGGAVSGQRTSTKGRQLCTVWCLYQINWFVSTFESPLLVPSAILGDLCIHQELVQLQVTEIKLQLAQPKRNLLAHETGKSRNSNGFRHGLTQGLNDRASFLAFSVS